MGREATCLCKWGDEQGDCKVLLESGDLILRHGIRRRVPWVSMSRVSVRGGDLVFNVGQDHVELNLGPQVAQRWAKIIASPLPTLASKLGISPSTRISVVGDVQSEELRAAVAEARTASGKEVNLVLICVNSQSEVDSALDRLFASENCSGPVWIVYPKGTNSEVKESALREPLRSHGFIDTKIASVSAKLTAIRFNKRRSNREA